jgi:capsid protein
MSVWWREKRTYTGTHGETSGARLITSALEQLEEMKAYQKAALVTSSRGTAATAAAAAVRVGVAVAVAAKKV